MTVGGVPDPLLELLGAPPPPPPPQAASMDVTTKVAIVHRRISNGFSALIMWFRLQSMKHQVKSQPSWHQLY